MDNKSTNQSMIPYILTGLILVAMMFAFYLIYTQGEMTRVSINNDEVVVRYSLLFQLAVSAILIIIFPAAIKSVISPQIEQSKKNRLRNTGLLCALIAGTVIYAPNLFLSNLRISSNKVSYSDYRLIDYKQISIKLEDVQSINLFSLEHNKDSVKRYKTHYIRFAFKDGGTYEERLFGVWVPHGCEEIKKIADTRNIPFTDSRLK